MFKLYIGIDFGWSDLRYEVQNHFGRTINRGSAPATPEGLRKILKKFAKYGKVIVAYEAGTQMYWIQAEIEMMNMTPHPFHAGRFALGVKTKGKSDKKDAFKICRAAVKGQLPDPLYMPPEQERRLRESLQERDDYRGELKRIGNRLHAYATSKGERIPKDDFDYNKPTDWEKIIPIFAGSDYQKKVERLYRTALTLLQTLEEIEEDIKEQMNQPEFKQAQEILVSIPGIGFWTSTTLIAWSGTQAQRFPDSRSAASYFGITSNNRQSGEMNRYGHISKEGPSMVRRVGVEAAWAFLRSRQGKESAWGRWYYRRTNGNKNRKKVMAVALAHKLIRCAIACLQKQTKWNQNHENPCAV